jgi:hypothetical protein
LSTLTRVPINAANSDSPQRLNATSPPNPGYELCANCIQSAGVNHALQGNSGSGPGSVNVSAGAAPPSPEEAQRTLSQWRRTAPKQKGHFRHAYVEKVWGPGGWKDVGEWAHILVWSLWSESVDELARIFRTRRGRCVLNLRDEILFGAIQVCILPEDGHL